MTRLADARPGMPVDGRNGIVLRWSAQEIHEDSGEGNLEVFDGEKLAGTIKLEDLSADIWVAWDEDGRRFSITWSDGGALGGFHVRVFDIVNQQLAELPQAIHKAVADFASRHNCKSRGNNVKALRWYQGDLLLMTDVYPTGDCGADLGHTEGYLVRADDGKVIRHLTLFELMHFPGVCLRNDEK